MPTLHAHLLNQQKKTYSTKLSGIRTEFNYFCLILPIQALIQLSSLQKRCLLRTDSLLDIQLVSIPAFMNLDDTIPFTSLQHGDSFNTLGYIPLTKCQIYCSSLTSSCNCLFAKV